MAMAPVVFTKGLTFWIKDYNILNNVELNKQEYHLEIVRVLAKDHGMRIGHRWPEAGMR